MRGKATADDSDGAPARRSTRHTTPFSGTRKSDVTAARCSSPRWSERSFMISGQYAPIAASKMQKPPIRTLKGTTGDADQEEGFLSSEGW